MNKYLENISTHANTIGMGDPQPPTNNSVGTEPLPIKTAKAKRMKRLKDHIKESILGNWEDIDIEKDIKSEIKQFLKDNYRGRFSITLDGDNYVVNSRTSVIVMNKNISSLTNKMFRFGDVKDFDCSYCESLTSLEGAPEKVRDFDCRFCDFLTSLEGAPKVVSGDFKCRYCNSLKTLKGAPEKVGGNFECGHCDALINLEGAPKKVSRVFNCYGCNSLINLEGAPKEVGKDFQCCDCKRQFTEKDVTDVCNVKGSIKI